MNVRTLIRRIEQSAPPRYAAAWDASGVQVAGTAEEVTRVAVLLDPLSGRLREPLTWGADFILAHHPLALTPRLPDRLDDYHRALSLLLQRGCWLYAAHTSLDANPAGPAGWLAAALGFGSIRVLEPVSSEDSLFVHFKATGDIEASLEQMQSQGLVLSFGRMGPARFWCSCPRGVWPEIATILEAQEVSDVQRIAQESPVMETGFGLVGRLHDPMNWSGFAPRLANLLGTSEWQCAGRKPASIGTVAYCPGSGGTLIRAAARSGADVFVTGDVKYHQAHEAYDHNTFVLDVGHFILEERMMSIWAGELEESITDIEVRFFPGKDPIRRISP